MTSFYKTLIRPAMIFFPLTAGFFLPSAAAFAPAIRWLLAFMLLTTCLRMRLGRLRLERAHWILLLMNFALGFGGYLLISAFGSSARELALLVFFTGIMPTANAAPVVVSFLHGRLEFALAGFVLSNVAIPLSFLFLLPLVTGKFTVAFFGTVCLNLAVVVALPVALAYLLRKISPRVSDFSAKCALFTFSLWSVTLFLVAASARHQLEIRGGVTLSNILLPAAVALAACVLNFGLGRFAGPRSKVRECSQLLGQKNTSLVMYLALFVAQTPAAALGPVFYAVWQNLWNARQMFRYDRRRVSRAQQRQIMKGPVPS